MRNSTSRRVPPRVAASSARKACGLRARVRGELSSTKVAHVPAPLSMSPAKTHGSVRAKPCCGSGPRSANCGKHTGIPPRIGRPASYALRSLTYRHSSPVDNVQETSCAPCSVAIARAPSRLDQRTAGMPWNSTSSAALTSGGLAAAPAHEVHRRLEELRVLRVFGRVLAVDLDPFAR